MIQCSWSDCQRAEEEIVALRLKDKGSVFRRARPGRLSRCWRQGSGRASRSALETGGLSRPAGSPSRHHNLCLLDIRASRFPTEHSTCGSEQCRAIGVGDITAHGLRRRAATTSSTTWERICGKSRNCPGKNIRITARYIRTAEALNRALE